jgi:hypothetical protein
MHDGQPCLALLLNPTFSTTTHLLRRLEQDIRGLSRLSLRPLDMFAAKNS